MGSNKRFFRGEKFKKKERKRNRTSSIYKTLDFSLLSVNDRMRNEYPKGLIKFSPERKREGKNQKGKKKEEEEKSKLNSFASGSIFSWLWETSPKFALSFSLSLSVFTVKFFFFPHSQYFFSSSFSPFPSHSFCLFSQAKNWKRKICPTAHHTFVSFILIPCCICNEKTGVKDLLFLFTLIHLIILP